MSAASGSPSCGTRAWSVALAASRKTIEHPQVGPLTLDCDLLRVEGNDLHVLVYSAEPGTEAAEKLRLISVLGTQSLVGGRQDTSSGSRS